MMCKLGQTQNYENSDGAELEALEGFFLSVILGTSCSEMRFFSGSKKLSEISGSQLFFIIIIKYHYKMSGPLTL